jgi:chromosome segregation ATPase
MTKNIDELKRSLGKLTEEVNDGRKKVMILPGEISRAEQDKSKLERLINERTAELRELTETIRRQRAEFAEAKAILPRKDSELRTIKLEIETIARDLRK